MKTIFSAWLGCVPALALAAGLPDPVLPQGVGVNIHFTRGHEQDLDLIAAAGFRVIRMDFGWAGIERKKGEYDWSDYDELTRNLERRGLRPYYILDYSNPLYEETVTSKNPITGEEQRDTASPQRPESVAAFARWAAASVQHFKGRSVLWEIWNEPNISFWKPKPDVRQYAALALATGKAIRAVDPQAIVVAPATSELPWPFLEELFRAGALEYLDAVSVHPYRNYRLGPETAAEDYRRLRELIERYAPGAKKKLPILSGEWGYASHRQGVSLETQGAFIARQQLANLLNGVPVSIWYDWKNDGTDLNEREHNFGTVTPELRPKPAYVAVQTLTRELAGYRIEKRLAVGTEKDFVLWLTDGRGGNKLAGWTTGEPHLIQIALTGPSDAPLPVVASDGRTTEVALSQGRIPLELTAAPRYVRLGTRQVPSP